MGYTQQQPSRVPGLKCRSLFFFLCRFIFFFIIEFSFSLPPSVSLCLPLSLSLKKVGPAWTRMGGKIAVLSQSLSPLKAKEKLYPIVQTQTRSLVPTPRKRSCRNHPTGPCLRYSLPSRISDEGSSNCEMFCLSPTPLTFFLDPTGRVIAAEWARICLSKHGKNKNKQVKWKGA